MEDLRIYYEEQARSQPEPSAMTIFASAPKKNKNHLVRKAILIAAAVATLLTTPILAATASRIFNRPADSGNTDIVFPLEEFDISEKLREYLADNEIDPIDSGLMRGYKWKLYIVAFSSISEVESFFGVDIASNVILDQSLKSVIAHIYSDPDNTGTVYLEFDADDGIPYGIEFTYGQPGKTSDISVRLADEDIINTTLYFSPLSGIEAQITNSSMAVFSRSNLLYKIGAPDSRFCSLETLKEIIDAFR